MLDWGGVDRTESPGAACGILNLTARLTCIMPNILPLPPPGFDELSVDEKLDYLQALWDRVGATPETITVPNWHRDILDERLKDLQDAPEAGDTWEAVRDRLGKNSDCQH